MEIIPVGPNHVHLRLDNGTILDVQETIKKGEPALRIQFEKDQMGIRDATGYKSYLNTCRTDIFYVDIEPQITPK